MPPSAPGQLDLDPKEIGDAMDWSMRQIGEHLPEMIQTAGFIDLAKTVDRDALRGQAPDRVREAIAATAGSL